MAYNSDGYIMIDFTEVDFRRTNQTIDGLYKRCVDVIGTNKFILVINANGKTPLPSTCSFINNQYVIESYIYTFAVSANDNLFIKRNDPDPSRLIDDTVIVNNKVWSSLNTVEMLAPIDTVVGNPAIFNTSLALPLVACTAEFMCTQEGSGDPSPSNVRNIVGVDDITLTINGNTVVIDLNGTRYGGYVVNDKLYITTQYIVLTENDTFVSYTFSGKNGVRCTELTENGNRNNGKCSHTVINGSGSDYMWLGVSDKRIYWVGILDTLGLSDVNQFVSWITNNHVEVVVEYDEPLQTIPLSDIPTLSTIIGNNSFASDTGSIKVSYKCLPTDLL